MANLRFADGSDQHLPHAPRGVRPFAIIGGVEAVVRGYLAGSGWAEPKRRWMPAVS